jgi:pimeloyl-ACP methyl ester carboxylesterase
MMSEVDQVIAPGKMFKLKDGRSLGYLEVGDPHGKPLLHFHGTPGCRLDVLFGRRFAEENGIRFIGLDRPGLGLSDFQPRRKLLDWPDDVLELADGLGIEKFAVQGVSGGGPFSLACAYKIPDRLAACGVIVGMGPAYLSTKGMHFANRLIFFLSRYFPWFTGLMLRKSARETQDLRASIKSMQEHLDDNFQKHDADALRDPERMGIFALGAREAFRSGTRGIAYEAKIFMDPWGFRLQDIRCPNLHLWHGELDTNVPIAMARHMAEAIPNCQSHFYPNDGHYSLPLNYLTDIMSVLTII